MKTQIKNFFKLFNSPESLKEFFSTKLFTKKNIPSFNFKSIILTFIFYYLFISSQGTNYYSARGVFVVMLCFLSVAIFFFLAYRNIHSNDVGNLVKLSQYQVIVSLLLLIGLQSHSVSIFFIQITFLITTFSTIKLLSIVANLNEK